MYLAYSANALAPPITMLVVCSVALKDMTAKSTSVLVVLPWDTVPSYTHHSSTSEIQHHKGTAYDHRHNFKQMLGGLTGIETQERYKLDQNQNMN